MPTYLRTILITGGTHGLGYETALHIAKERPEFLVIVASRNDNGTADKINKLNKQDNAKFLPLNLASLAGVRAFADQWPTYQHPPIHALMLNAVLQSTSDYELTEDGIERTFAISHVGHALLFNLMRQYLADNARIIISGSGTHDPAQKSGMPDAHFESAEALAHPPPHTESKLPFPGLERYTCSKLANVLYMYALERRLRVADEKHGKSWTVTVIDPGLMPATGLSRSAPLLLRYLVQKILPLMLPLLRMLYNPNVHSPQKSSRELAKLALSNEFEGKSGMYYEGTREEKTSVESHDVAKQEDLWKWTIGALARNDEERRLFALEDLA